VVGVRRLALWRPDHVPSAVDPLPVLSDHAGLLVTLAR
jgi:hypothetical protein